MKEVLKVIKIGGHIIEDSKSLTVFLSEFSKIKGHKILVHGGGKLASSVSQKMGVAVEFIDGRRVTNQATLDIITMCYAGKINKSIVAELQSYNCNTLGFTGADGNIMIAKKRSAHPIDFGFVGDIIQVNTQVLELLLKQHITPVLCAISHDTSGQLLNTNADTIAAEIASAFSKLFSVELYYCFEKSGVMRDIKNDQSLIPCIDRKKYKLLLQQKAIGDGMLPKLQNCFYASKNGVDKIAIGRPEMVYDSSIKYTLIK